MRRRGNCPDTALAESLFQLLKRERIRRRPYRKRDAARQSVFDAIEMFQNPTRKHTNNCMLSPLDYETRQRSPRNAGVYATRGTSVQPDAICPDGATECCASLVPWALP